MKTLKISGKLKFIRAKKNIFNDKDYVITKIIHDDRTDWNLSLSEHLRNILLVLDQASEGKKITLTLEIK